MMLVPTFVKEKKPKGDVKDWRRKKRGKESITVKGGEKDISRRVKEQEPMSSCLEEGSMSQHSTAMLPSSPPHMSVSNSNG